RGLMRRWKDYRRWNCRRERRLLETTERVRALWRTDFATGWWGGPWGKLVGGLDFPMLLLGDSAGGLFLLGRIAFLEDKPGQAAEQSAVNEHGRSPHRPGDQGHLQCRPQK